MSDPLGRVDPARASGAPPAPRQDSRGFSDLPSQVLGDRYVVERELDHGGMSCILLAHDRRLNRPVAIKVLLSGAAADPELRLLEREARLVGALGHPNVVEVHDIGTYEGRPFIVEERLEGQTLRRRMNEGRVPVADAIDIATQIARGLAAAHERGVVHCDVKPENVFLMRDGRVKILDFGVARLAAREDAGSAAESTTTGRRFAGTPPYSSPEQIRGAPVDARSDIFSLGCVLYEMLAGRRPFDGASSVETAYAVLQGNPEPLPSEVPSDLQRIVGRCLEKDPAKRFQSAKDLAFDLEGIAGGARTARRRRWWTAPALAALGIAIGAGIVLLAPRRTAPPPAFRQMTFLGGAVWSARFGSDGREVLFTEAFDGESPRILASRVVNPDYQRVDSRGTVLLAVSSRGDVALLEHPQFRVFDFSGTLAVIPAGGGTPREIAEHVDYADWSPDGVSLAIVRRVGGEQQLECPVGRVLFKTTGWISHPRVSHGGDEVAFLHHPDLPVDSGAVMLVGKDGKARTLVGGWEAAMGLSWSPGGNEIWFTAQASSPRGASMVVRAVDRAGNHRVLWQSSGDLKLEDVASDGTAVVTAPRRYMGIAASSAEGERDLSTRDEQILQDLSADGARVLFTVNPRSPDGQGLLFVRATDGSPPLQIGTGFAGALSPDAKAALIFPWGDPNRSPALVPLAARDPAPVLPLGLSVTRAKFFPDGRQVLVVGNKPGRSAQIHVLTLADGTLRPISDEGVDPWRVAVAPDGKLVAGIAAGGTMTLYPADGSARSAVRDALPGEVPYDWTADGALLVGRALESPLDIYRIDRRTNQRTLWKTIRARAGAYAVTRAYFAAEVAAYSYVTWKTHLYLVDGLR